MMATVRLYFYATVAALLAFFGVYLYNKGRQDEADEHTQDDFYAVREAKKVRDEVEGDPYFVERAKRWVKDD